MIVLDSNVGNAVYYDNLLNIQLEVRVSNIYDGALEKKSTCWIITNISWVRVLLEKHEELSSYATMPSRLRL